MKKMIFRIVPLIMVLAGCASSGTTVAEAKGNSPGKNLDAAKLAADLNASKAEGGTVRLANWVEIKTGLTVPEGVTLDLTADGAALELQDGAVLTVNGTVNATGHGDHGKGWVEGSLRIGDGAAGINGSGTIYLKGKGLLFNIGGGRDRRRHLTLDGVTLVGLPDNDNSLIRINENGGLVLKGGAITGNTCVSDEWASSGGVETWRGTFSMEGGTISGNSAQGKEGSGGGGVRVSEESVFTMTGGEISGNTAGQGGGVLIDEGSTFTMTDGIISGNTATGQNGGGGVMIREGSAFIMEGGTISGNTAAGNLGGGGVKVRGGSSSTFTMKGGSISGNTTVGGGGGVNVSSKDTFTMKGGTISGNSAKHGGGVTADGATFILEGGTISGNTAEYGGGASSMFSGTFTMKGGTISDNTATSQYGGGGVIIGENGSFTKTGGTIYGDTDTTHTAGSAENTSLNGLGHAVRSSRNRNATLGPGDNISTGDLSTNWDR
jgi:hypothetical protein